MNKLGDSLHQTAVLEKFADKCYTAWKKWNSHIAIGIGHWTKAAMREKQFEKYISELCHEVNICRVPSHFEPLDDWGGFSRDKWELTIRNTDFKNDDVPLKQFVEVCKTIIHELRHAEQYYRMAQGVYLGYLDYPGSIKKKPKVSLTGQAPQEAITAADLESALSMAHKAGLSAINNSARYENFALSARLDHCVRGRVPNRPNDNWTLTVDNWLQRRFRKGMKEWGYKALGNNAEEVVETQFYWRGELDTDTMALEAILEGLLKRKWRNYDSVKNKGRKNAVFA